MTHCQCKVDKLHMRYRRDHCICVAGIVKDLRKITFWATRWRFKRQFRFKCWKEYCSISMLGSNGDKLESPSDQHGKYISHMYESTR